MKKMFKAVVVFIWIILLFFAINAQSFSFEMDQTFLSASPQPNGQLKFTGTITNLTDQPINVNLNRTETVLPQGWSSSICVGITCNDPSVSSVRISMEAHEAVHLELDVNVHESVPGAAEIYLAVSYNLENISHRLVASTDPNGMNDENNRQSGFTLLQNYPNPFNPVTTIPFEIKEPGGQQVELAIYNLAGQLVTPLFKGYKSRGYHEVRWNGTDENGIQVASGLYFVRLLAGKNQLIRSMVLMK